MHCGTYCYWKTVNTVVVTIPLGCSTPTSGFAPYIDIVPSVSPLKYQIQIEGLLCVVKFCPNRFIISIIFPLTSKVLITRSNIIACRSYICFKNWEVWLTFDLDLHRRWYCIPWWWRGERGVCAEWIGHHLSWRVRWRFRAYLELWTGTETIMQKRHLIYQ